MRQLLRVFTIVSFAVFVITATLAFSVRPASAAGTQPVDAGSSDGGPARSGSSQAPIGNVFGGSGDREYLAGSKAFGASVAPEGFGGLGLRGGGSGEGIGGLGFRTPQVVDVVVAGGPLTRAEARQLATAAVGVRLAEEPCVVGPGVFVVELVVSPQGRVDSARELPVDGGFVRGAECVVERAKKRVARKAKGPSTVLVTYEVGRPLP
ncbi:MAG: hypothetical protein Q8S33_12630 [Myxococcales bacterium]|nr:hypothetical protein [Myxococcales bacterium]MDP3501181.1 hypothetical protein [Myxococcales bacterium]